MHRAVTRSDRLSWAALGLVAVASAVAITTSAVRHAPVDATPPPADAAAATAPAPCIVLDGTLAEISDLALAADGESLWAVHDEKGKLFRISTRDGSILEAFEFHKKGDFEAITVVDGRLLVGRSDGELFWVDPKTHQSSHFSSQLGPACDLEGLAWEPAKHRVLLSCKQPQGDKADRTWRVFSMDPERETVDPEPAFVIHRGALEAAKVDDTDPAHADPSGIAVDPRDGAIEMISTRGRMRWVLAADGGVTSVHPLPRETYRQPEGITFGRDGTRFISNEARGAQATLCHEP